MRIAAVYYKDRYAGELVELDNGHFRFTYDQGYLKQGPSIAFRFPLTEVPYEYPNLPPFFENLASEGWLRRVQAKSQGISEADTFGLLLNNGRDMVGAVTLLPANKVDPG